ncbi:UNVERIFIED_CONTAM: hypothetical protein Sangu_2588400 [Sesamum angustifolium]|uniref:3'-5' exonuclease domain-containing protein n=1 Tax=Sesamum angustifolium TaxID=2727405 RepID=A0AAW2J6N8_9LAMI
MEYDPERIHPHHSPNPAKLETYTVICHSHRVRTVVTAKPAVVREWVHKIRYHHRHQLRHGRLVVGLESSGSPAIIVLPPPSSSVWVTTVSSSSCYTPPTPPPFCAASSPNPASSSSAGQLQGRQHAAELEAPPPYFAARGCARRGKRLEGCSRGASMESLAAKILGMDGVEKKEWVGRSAWDETWLSEEQVEYACVDAFLCFLMAKALRVWKWGED